MAALSQDIEFKNNHVFDEHSHALRVYFIQKRDLEQKLVVIQTYKPGGLTPRPNLHGKAIFKSSMSPALCVSFAKG
jgi:hypothetical protein